jgi:predicted metal-dependent hydrolase
MLAPLTILDYIVVHELARPRHPNRIGAFRDAVDNVLPAWRERKAWPRIKRGGMDPCQPVGSCKAPAMCGA